MRWLSVACYNNKDKKGCARHYQVEECCLHFTNRDEEGYCNCTNKDKEYCLLHQ
jgi:hypothetical protein